MLTIATGVATSVLAMVLCINFQAPALDVESTGGMDPSVSHQLDHWAGWITGGSVSAVPEAQAEDPTPAHAALPHSKATTATPAASDTLFDTANCGDPNDPLNFCL
jgi:hypothetical protein